MKLLLLLSLFIAHKASASSTSPTTESTAAPLDTSTPVPATSPTPTPATSPSVAPTTGDATSPSVAPTTGDTPDPSAATTDSSVTPDTTPNGSVIVRCGVTSVAIVLLTIILQLKKQIL